MPRPNPTDPHARALADPFQAGYFNGFHNRDHDPADPDGDPLDLDADGNDAYAQGWAAGHNDYDDDGFYGQSAGRPV